MTFELHPNLQKKILICHLPLSDVLLEDEMHYPWLMLVPRRAHISKLMDLKLEDQLQLLHELDLAQKIILEHFQPTQLNVAAIGNKTPQLHVHVIGRFDQDPAWPKTVWDHPTRAPYSSDRRQEIISLLQVAFKQDGHGS